MDVLSLLMVFLQVVNSSNLKSITIDNVVVDQKLTIPCAIKMSPRSGLLQWLFRAHDSDSYKLMCRKTPEENDCVNKNNREQWLENIQMSMESLEIDRVSINNGGTYVCKYMDSSNLEKFTIVVNVLTPPGKPKIHASPETFVANSVVTLRCETAGGNPKPSLTWAWKDFSNEPIPKTNIINETLTQLDSLYGQTILTINWIPKSVDDGKSISCSAENQVASISSNWMYLNVNYPPIIIDFPTSPYFALLGSDISIECKASRKTTVSFRWWSNKGVIVSDTAQLIIKSISKIHKGSYRCSVTNPFGTTSASVNISVLSSPIIEVARNLVVAEGELLKATCNVVPVFSNVSWWMNSKSVSNNSSLEIRLSDIKPVEFQCRASVLLIKFPGSHVMASSKESVNVIVQYKPRRPRISVHPIGFLMTGIDVTVTCVTDQNEPGYPKPDYFWQKSNSKWIKNSTNFISFSSLTFDDSGVYVCTLFNIIGKSNETIYDLVVYGQPILIDPVLQSPSIVKVKEGQSFSMICHFQAYPEPEISWFNDDIAIGYLVNMTGYRLEQKQTSNNAFLSLLHVDRLVLKSSDTYRCLATNKYGTIHHEYNVNIQYAPKLIADQFMIAADSKGQSVKGETVHLNCTISGTQNMSIIWFRKLANNNENLIENSSDHYYIRERVYNNRVKQSVLFVRNFQNEDYGRYFCLAKNSEGHLETEFDIRKLSIPDPSHDLILFKQSWNSLTFKWIAGFDGGYPQIFLVSYITDMQAKPTQSTTDKPNITLTNLLPDTYYTVTITSSNRMGTTQATLSAKVKTEALTVGDEKIVTLNKEEQTLELKLPMNLSANIFCLTVEELENNQPDITGSWTIMKRCLKDYINRIPIDNISNRFRVRICLISVPDVCSSPITNSPENESAPVILSTKLIGTVAAACTVLVIVLAILLFFILIKTRRFLPEISGFKDLKRNRKSSRDDFASYISKPLTTMCPSKHGILLDSGGCPLLNTYSCDQVHMSNSPLEIFNVCSNHNIFHEGLYSTLVKSSSLNMFSNDVSPTPVMTGVSFVDQSPCCCRKDQQMCTIPTPQENITKTDKIFYEVMV